MTQSDLICALMEKENLTHEDAEAVVKLIFSGFAEAMLNVDRIEIRGFGSFEMRNYALTLAETPNQGRRLK